MCKGIKFIGRFVDDILCFFNKDFINLEKIQEYANSFSRFLKFTIEKECSRKLNYLDITIIRMDNELYFKRYWK